MKAANWSLRLGEDLIEPFPNYGDAMYDAPQHDAPGPSSGGPWSHLRAFSAPEPQIRPFFDGPAAMLQDLQHRSPDPLGSFAGKSSLH